MALLGAELLAVEPGQVQIGFTFRDDLTQQHGTLHAGVTTAIADSACGYAALTLMEPGTAVLSVEYKVNLLAPAAGNRFVATGQVVRSGRKLSVCTGEVRALAADGDTVVLLMQHAAPLRFLSPRASCNDTSFPRPGRFRIQYSCVGLSYERAIVASDVAHNGMRRLSRVHASC